MFYLPLSLQIYNDIGLGNDVIDGAVEDGIKGIVTPSEQKGNIPSRNETFICPTCSEKITDTSGHNKGLDRKQAPSPGYQKLINQSKVCSECVNTCF